MIKFIVNPINLILCPIYETYLRRQCNRRQKRWETYTITYDI